MPVETRYKICPLCSATCGLDITTNGRNVLEVRASQADSFSQGHICPKGVAIKELDADPDRLRSPMIRRGSKWREATWDEAFAEIDHNISRIVAEHGRNALGAYVGNPAGHNIGFLLFGPPLLRAMGTPNFFSSNTVDAIPKQLTSAWMFGTPRSIPIPDLGRCTHLLVLGANPLVSGGSMMVSPGVGERLKAIQARGGKVVVIDPAFTKTAKAADEHHFIRPGTDAFFLLAMVHVLFEENRVSLGRLGEHCNGIDEVRELSKPFTPEAAAEKCGISAEEIRRIAREFADAPAAALHARMGTCTQEFGTLASWLPDVIHVLTGNLDRPGGAMFPLPALGGPNSKGTPGKGHEFKTGRRRSRVSGYPEVMGELPCCCLSEEIDTPGEGQIRALLTVAGNPVLSTPNGERLRKALESLEFMVSLDIYLNETTRHAHVILPGLSHLENPHYGFSAHAAVRNYARYSPALFDPPEGAPYEWKTIVRLTGLFLGKGHDADIVQLDDEQVLAAINKELGSKSSPIHGRNAGEILKALEPRRGPERMLDLMLRTGPYGEGFGANPAGLTLEKLEAHPEGIDLGALKPRIPEALRTHTGKIELAPKPIVADMARLESTLMSGSKELLLINRRHLRSNNSWMHNLPSLVSGKPRCTLLMNTQDAEKANLATGETARVASKSAALEIPVEVTQDIMPGVVSIPHGWGHEAANTRQSVAGNRAGVNCNALLDEKALDLPSGNAALFGVPVTVTALDESKTNRQASYSAAK